MGRERFDGKSRRLNAVRGPDYDEHELQRAANEDERAKYRFPRTRANSRSAVAPLIN